MSLFSIYREILEKAGISKERISKIFFETFLGIKKSEEERKFEKIKKEKSNDHRSYHA